MRQHHYIIPVSTPKRVHFADVTRLVQEIVSEQGFREGIVNIYSQHTSCSVFIQEESEDVTYLDTQFILQDLLNVFEKIIPTCHYERQYLHPGPVHVENAVRERNELREWALNTDAHLRSVMIGRSETVPILEGLVVLGEFGRLYFADFDHTRERERKVRVHIIGE
jgi:secondary thiamine-phosphate synthase enzyme